MADLRLAPASDQSFDVLVDHLVARRHLGQQADEILARVAAEGQVERVRERTEVLEVRDGPTAVGRVWLVEQGDDRAVLHLTLDDPDRAGPVRVLLEEHARGLGARRLTVGVFPGDPVTEGLVAGADYDTAAVQMRLDLGRTLPDEDVVVLEPMDDAAYAAWEADEVEGYADDLVRSGHTRERALEVSRQQHEELLPDGLATAHHDFFVGVVDGVRVGTLWIGTERPMAFVYYVEVDEAHRRRGHGGGLMRAGALWARDHVGSHALGLNVFGYNHGARALYDALGYDVVEVFMGRQL